MPTKARISDKPLSTRERVFIEKYMEFGGGKGAGTPAAVAAGNRILRDVLRRHKPADKTSELHAYLAGAREAT